MYLWHNTCKRTVPQDFILQVFSWIGFPQAQVCGHRYRWQRRQISHRFRWYWWCTLICEYIRKFSKTFEITLTIHEKSKAKKISLHCPFNVLSAVWTLWSYVRHDCNPLEKFPVERLKSADEGWAERPISNGNASETKANKSFVNGVFFDIEAKWTPSKVSKLFSKRSEHIQ